jgi:hypothetical protein
MAFLILGLVLLVILILAGRGFISANPRTLAKNLRKLAGIALLGVVAYLSVTGRFLVAIPLGVFALGLLGMRMPWQQPDWGVGGAGRQSQVRTDMLEMTLDHGTGEMDGVVRSGPFVGRSLSQLTPAELGSLLDEARRRDAQAAQLLEAYIARSGRETAGGAGQGSGGRSSGPMTLEEAYAVLGLQPGATRDDILQAHRALMKKYHPDQGGTTYLAAKINEAKDVLLQRGAA